MVRAKLFWNDGLQMQAVKSHCMMKVGQKKKIKEYDSRAIEDHSYQPTPEDRGRWQRNWFIVLNKGAPRRQQPDFREAKRAYCRQFKEHVESTGQGNQPIHPAQQRRQNPQQQFESQEECAHTVHPRTGWRYCPATSSSSSSQWQQNDEWKSSQSRDYWRSSTWTEQ